jgi:branched-chain amino acid transport system permease protein
MIARLRLLAVPGVVALVVVAAMIVAANANTFQIILLTRGLVLALLAASVWFLLRICDLPSFGHAAFFGIGAYTAGLAVTRWGVGNVFVALALGVAVTCAVALPIALVASRLRSISFLLVTLAFAEMLRSLAMRWRTLGGSDGLVGVVRPSAAPFRYPLSGPVNYFYFTLAVVVICLVALRTVTRSGFGATLVGIRDSDTRMAALGYSPATYRVVAIVMSAALAGIAGVLHAFLNRYVNPEDLSPLVSARALLTVVVGGVPLVGPPILSILLTELEDALSSWTERWMGVLGLIYIVVALANTDRLGLGRLRERLIGLVGRPAGTRGTGAPGGTATPLLERQPS